VTALTPIPAAVGPGSHRAFVVDYTATITVTHQARPDGRALFPFRRAFVVAVRAMR
jgi:trans-aconitate methyltransferase